MLRFLCLVAAALQVANCGFAQHPYVSNLSPASVTYLNGPAPAALRAGPLAYAAPTAYAAPAAYAAAPAYPTAYAAPAAYHQAYAAPAAYGYAAPAVAKYAVPTVHHVPAVADVPVTHYEAQPAVINKQFDVAKPAVQTRRFQVRRPAIQKQFYDIEERVIVRPAGSALVELDEPISKTQKGATVVSPLVHPVAHALPAYAPVHAAFPAYAPIAAPAYPASIAAPAPAQQPEQPQQAPQQEQQQQQQPQQDLESVSIENPDFGARTAAPEPEQAQPTDAAPAEPQQENQEQPEPAPEARAQVDSEAEQRAQLEAQQNNAQRQQYEAQQREAAQARSQPAPAPRAQEIQPDFLGRQEQQLNTEALFRNAFAAEPRQSIPSFRNLNPEVNKANQERLIQLLTARGGVAEVQGYPAGSTRTNGNIGDAGTVRARVLSATPAPKTAEPTGERVNTRRIVVSRPIETVQEFDVVEPATKIHRINIQQPTFVKTARLGVARVATSVPVYGKTLAAHPISYY